MGASTDLLRTLCAHEEWAAARFDEAIAGLTDAEFTRALGPGLGSVASRAAHVVDADELWLGRIEDGVSPRAMPDDRRFGSVAEFRAHAARVAGRKRALLARADEAELDRVIAYANTRGERFTQPLREMLGHLVMHAMYHRGQISVALRALGKTPPATDLIAFLRTRR